MIGAVWKEIFTHGSERASRGSSLGLLTPLQLDGIHMQFYHFGQISFPFNSYFIELSPLNFISCENILSQSLNFECERKRVNSYKYSFYVFFLKRIIWKRILASIIFDESWVLHEISSWMVARCLSIVRVQVRCVGVIWENISMNWFWLE